MNSLSKLFSNEFIYAAGWTIVHSLWQCTLIALLITMSYAFTKKAQASTRYWINTLGLLSCVFIGGITFYMNFNSAISVDIISNITTQPVKPENREIYSLTVSGIINQHINKIVLFWVIGFGFYISKYLADFYYCQQIKHRNNKSPSDATQQLFNELKNNVGITQNIQLRISEIVNIPCVIGHFVPVVLLPASLLLGLNTQQIKVILLHELGHIHRRDYLISSIQTLVTSLYFFNPFARWISSKIDEERENSCDDIAVSVSGDPLFYAHTLKEFSEMKYNYAPAVTITGRNNLLLNRIKRLFVHEISFSKTYGKAITIMTLTLLSIGFSILSYSSEENKIVDSFEIKLEKEPLSNLLKLSQYFCPKLSKNIQLKHADQPISGNFTNLKCDTVEYVIKGIDDGLDITLTGVLFNEKDITLKELVRKIEYKCPTLVGKILITHPDKLVGFETQNLSCPAVEQTIAAMDKNNDPDFVRQTDISDIKFRDNPDPYNQAISLSFPKEALDKGYTANCNVHYSVDIKGKAFDISPKCINGSEEAKAIFERHMKLAIEEVQFPIITENNNAVVVRDKELKVNWNIQKPLSSTNENEKSK